jgi:hypothetical protein
MHIITVRANATPSNIFQVEESAAERAVTRSYVGCAYWGNAGQLLRGGFVWGLRTVLEVSSIRIFI